MLIDQSENEVIDHLGHVLGVKILSEVFGFDSAPTIL